MLKTVSTTCFSFEYFLSLNRGVFCRSDLTVHTVVWLIVLEWNQEIDNFYIALISQDSTSSPLRPEKVT
jgi:hypothetical protein